MAIKTIRTALQAAEANNIGAAARHIADLATYVRGRMATDANFLTPALLTDIVDPDPAKGQISKAFADQAAFERWGRHFVPAYLSGLESDWAINFKDALSQVPRSAVVASHIQRGDDIFNSLPPPRASCAHYAPGGYSGGYAPPATMASIHNSSGVCFLGASLVKMADGTEKRCDEIQPGDVDIAGYRIKCVLKTLVTKADIVRVGASHTADGSRYAAGGYTLWHPVFIANKWQHPADVGIVETVQTDALYNFVLEETRDETGALYRPGVLIVDGVMTCTLGHGFTGPVIGHPYFGGNGSDSIIADLAGCRGWTEGHVTWGTSYPVRDPATGLITRMDFTEV